MDDSDRADVERVAASLTTAWNAGDGAAFARPFAERADFVNIYAMAALGRAAIAELHQAIFDGVYRGSRSLFTVAKSRPLGQGVVLAHIRAELNVPHGPMAGKMRTLATAVLLREGSDWCITSFHNTREQSPPALPHD